MLYGPNQTCLHSLLNSPIRLLNSHFLSHTLYWYLLRQSQGNLLIIAFVTISSTLFTTFITSLSVHFLLFLFSLIVCFLFIDSSVCTQIMQRATHRLFLNPISAMNKTKMFNNTVYVEILIFELSKAKDGNSDLCDIICDIHYDSNTLCLIHCIQ